MGETRTRQIEKRSKKERNRMNTIGALQKLDKDTRAEVYVVGGFVRDFLLKKYNNDLDTVVRNVPTKRIQNFLKDYGKTRFIKLSKNVNSFDINLLLFKAHNDTITAQIKLPTRGKTQIQDANNTLQQDCMHRDFTINAMYMPINASRKEEIIDLVGGLNDFNCKRISAVGEAEERIREHPARVLRAISLAARTNFKLDENVLFAIKHYVRKNKLNKIHPDSIRKELNHVLMCDKPSKYFKLMQTLGILRIIIPELDMCVGVMQERKYHKWDVFGHCIYTCDNLEKNLILRLAGVLHDIGKLSTKNVDKHKGITFHKHEIASVKAARKLLTKLKYSNDTKNEVLKLIRLHMYHYTRDFSDGAVRRFIKKSGITDKNVENLREFSLFKLRSAERLGNGFKKTAVTPKQKDFEARIIKVFNESTALQIADLDIDGKDIMEVFGLKESEHVGDILKFLLEKVLDDKDLNNRINLIGLAATYLKDNL